MIVIRFMSGRIKVFGNNTDTMSIFPEDNRVYVQQYDGLAEYETSNEKGYLCDISTSDFCLSTIEKIIVDGATIYDIAEYEDEDENEDENEDEVD